MLIPYLTFKDPAAAMALYEKALGAKSTMVMDGPYDSIMHAEMEVAGQTFMLSCEWPGMATAPKEGERSPVNFMVYVENADAAYDTAISAGMTSVQAPEDMFWGDRNAKVSDGHGYEWTLAHKVEELSAEEINTRAAAFAASME
ncbi:MAG: VOC family protein [Granulosicoccus sp.]|nr:VOC family protein [Granulosicoccus sp.]